MKKFLVWVLLGGSIMVLGPKGMELGSYDNKTSNYMTVGPEGMKLGNVNKQGNLFQLGKDGMSLGKVGDDAWSLNDKMQLPSMNMPDSED